MEKKCKDCRFFRVSHLHMSRGYCFRHPPVIDNGSVGADRYTFPMKDCERTVCSEFVEVEVEPRCQSCKCWHPTLSGMGVGVCVGPNGDGMRRQYLTEDKFSHTVYSAPQLSSDLWCGDYEYLGYKRGGEDGTYGSKKEEEDAKENV